MVYRDMFSQCVRCRRSLNRFSIAGYTYEICHDCNSIFVDERTLSAMWDEMSSGRALPRFGDRTDGAGVRGCPRCGEPMRRVDLLVVPVDHCPAHGVWFDKDELSTALAGAALPIDQWFHLFAAKLAAMS